MTFDWNEYIFPEEQLVNYKIVILIIATWNVSNPT